jgi:transcription initiation factor TFIIIB Brf1 subunit/transcription initiation factor TFIIB
MNCPACGSEKIQVFYTAPLGYRCQTCGLMLRDANVQGIPTLTAEDARTKRPAMYGLPVCSCCSHAPHEGVCRWCSEAVAPVVLVIGR